MAAIAAEVPSAPLSAPWLEIHSENFLCDGGPRLALLDIVATRYPMSCHGVGLSLGSAEGLDAAHLARLARLFERIKPRLVSEHLSWSVVGESYLNDLLPLPYTPATLDTLCRNVDRAQNFLGRSIAIENPSSYLRFAASTIPEPEFLNALVARTGCALILDVNNVYVTCANIGGDPRDYIAQIESRAVAEIHLAGHTRGGSAADPVLVDSHSARVCDDVWELYRDSICRIGPRPTLIEWDDEIPPLAVLLEEAGRAEAIMTRAAMPHVA
jgi:uncharacterized protein (UPF0276 family)